MDVGRRNDLEVTVCGELAGDERAARLLLGLGVVHFSMPPARVAAVKKSLIEANADRCASIVDHFRARRDQRGGELLEMLKHTGGAR